MPYIIDQELCSCCHRCRIECPADALRFKNSKYWIDPNRCVSCGHCAQVCHNDCISDPDTPVQIPAHHDPVEMTCDVLVIGGGAGGLAAAARAAELGRQVLVLEKNREIGGSAWYAHVFRSHYSKWHREAGMTDPRDAVYEEFMEKTQGHVNGKLVRRVLDANEQFIDWLIDKHELGKDYTFGPQFWGGYGPNAAYDWEYNHKRVDTTIGPGGTGWYLTNKLLSILLDHSGEIRYRTEAKTLEFDGTGAVCGVLAADGGGTLHINCKCCVIAAGAFSRNKELTGRFNPLFYDGTGEPVHVFTCSTCTGDGIRMCEEAGMDIDFHNARAGMFGPMRHPFGTASITAGMSRYGVDVTADGRVFDKNCFGEPISPLSFEPGRICWKITNEASVARACEEALGRPEDVPGCNMNRFHENWRNELARELEWETMYHAGTLAELGEKIGIPTERLAAALEHYNASCSKPETVMTPGGPVELPLKAPIQEGPYYAILLKLFHENALGGIVVDENTSVLKKGRPVTGLYAVGDNTRGIMMPGRVGAEYIEQTVSALTFAFCSGFIAGEEAAKNSG